MNKILLILYCNLPTKYFLRNISTFQSKSQFGLCRIKTLIFQIKLTMMSSQIYLLIPCQKG